MTRHYPKVNSVCDWSCRERHLPRPIRSATQIRVTTSVSNGISAVVAQQTSVGMATSSGVVKCRLFSQARNKSKLREFHKQKKAAKKKIVSSVRGLNLNFRFSKSSLQLQRKPQDWKRDFNRVIREKPLLQKSITC